MEKRDKKKTKNRFREGKRGIAFLMAVLLFWASILPQEAYVRAEECMKHETVTIDRKESEEGGTTEPEEKEEEGTTEAGEKEEEGTTEPEEKEDDITTEVEVLRERIWLDEDYIRKDGEIYIYGKDKKVSIYTDMEGIRLYKGAEEKAFAEAKNNVTEGNSVKKNISVSVVETVNITRIEVYGKVGKRDGWQRVKGISEENPLVIAVDQKAPEVKLVTQGEKKISQNDDVVVEIQVEDPVMYSGIQTIQYWVEKDGDKENPTQKQTLYTFDSSKDEITYSDFPSSWEGTITVDALLNNSCNVKLFVKVVDNAGNEMVESLNLDLDMIAPAVSISYDNNIDNNGNTYFNAQRSATVVITERTHHFDSEKALEGIKITAKDAKKNVVEEAYTISAWDTVEGETPDEATHTATVFFEKDANYTLDISHTDEAGNKNSEVKAGDSKAPFRFTVDTTAPTGSITAESEEGRKVTWEKLRGTLTFGFWSKKKITISAVAEDGDYTFGIQYTDLAGNRAKDISFAEGTAAGKAFTIDKTIPKFTISYDNNAAQNGNYYKASRIATIRVTEHNFDASRVIPKITASDNGKNIGTPGISSWKHKGDVHTATITYSADALYTFDISMKDKAGNEAQDYAEEKFYVDKTMPKLTITGVKNHSANTGDVIPVVSFSDTNFDSGHSTITLTGANRGNVKLEGSYSNGNNGRTFVFKNFAKEKEVDDIYTLSASTTDKAGNTVKQTVTFSVNRFGSTYELSRSLQKLNGSYVKEAGDIVLTEINPDALKNVKITLFKNNETMNLKEGENYKIQASGGNGEWYRYKYTIFKENFAENGVYRINVSSEDAAGNVAENTLDTKNQEIGFGVDAEKPLLNITNLEDHQTYPVEELIVLMTAKDNLILSNLVVYLDGEDVPFAEWTAEEIAEILSGKGEFTFTVAGDSKEAHSVKIVAKDAAGNEEIAEIKDFYVTTDVFVRFFNNKPLLYGSTAILVLLAGLALFLILKKKKDEEKNKNS